MIERLAREEQEKQWKKQQDQWNKDNVDFFESTQILGEIFAV